MAQPREAQGGQIGQGDVGHGLLLQKGGSDGLAAAVGAGRQAVGLAEGAGEGGYAAVARGPRDADRRVLGLEQQGGGVGEAQARQGLGRRSAQQRAVGAVEVEGRVGRRRRQLLQGGCARKVVGEQRGGAADAAGVVGQGRGAARHGEVLTARPALTALAEFRHRATLGTRWTRARPRRRRWRWRRGACCAPPAWPRSPRSRTGSPSPASSPRRPRRAARC